MGTGFVSFRQTPRGRGFSLLGFYSSLNTLLMFESNEAVRGRLIGLKTWDRIVVIFFRGPFLHSPWVGAVWVNCVLIYVLNGALVCIGSVITVNCGFTK